MRGGVLCEETWHLYHRSRRRDIHTQESKYGARSSRRTVLLSGEGIVVEVSDLYELREKARRDSKDGG